MYACMLVPFHSCKRAIHTSYVCVSHTSYVCVSHTLYVCVSVQRPDRVLLQHSWFYYTYKENCDIPLNTTQQLHVFTHVYVYYVNRRSHTRMCVAQCTRTHTITHTHTHTHTHNHTHTHTHTCMKKCIYVHVHQYGLLIVWIKCVCVCVCVGMYISRSIYGLDCLSAHTQTNMHIHIHIQITHTYTCTHTKRIEAQKRAA